MTVESGILRPRIVKLWIESSDSVHGAIRFDAFANRIRSRIYGITLVRLHVFNFLSHSDLHNAHMESWLIITRANRL